MPRSTNRRRTRPNQRAPGWPHARFLHGGRSECLHFVGYWARSLGWGRAPPTTATSNRPNVVRPKPSIPIRGRPRHAAYYGGGGRESQVHIDRSHWHQASNKASSPVGFSFARVGFFASAPSLFWCSSKRRARARGCSAFHHWSISIPVDPQQRRPPSTLMLHAHGLLMVTTAGRGVFDRSQSIEVPGGVPNATRPRDARRHFRTLDLTRAHALPTHTHSRHTGGPYASSSQGQLFKQAYPIDERLLFCLLIEPRPLPLPPAAAAADSRVPSPPTPQPAST